MFKKILVANRGEIALRILRTTREMGIASVAVYSDADVYAPFVSAADEAFRIGPPPALESYLNREILVETAHRAGADAIHPGYGFLAENPDFAEFVTAEEMTFIGPSAETMRLMGDKIAARKSASEANIPLVPGTSGAVTNLRTGQAFIKEHGCPVIVKAGGGGGGRGIRIVERDEDLEDALLSASREAQTYFHNPDVYLERYFPNAHHIEVQVAGDRTGTVVAWGERDCSTQRRRQKLIEETPSALSGHDRQELFDCSIRLASQAEYVGVGTVEFLYAGPGEFYFLEINTRIQVEHTITEEVSGVDLIRESIRLAAGESATEYQSPRGHAIQVRINAEEPRNSFSPGTGVIEQYREPGGPGIRVDSGVRQGYQVSPNYDSLIAKLIAVAPTRELAHARLLRAIPEFQITGVPTTLELLGRIASSDEFTRGAITTDWLDANIHSLVHGRHEPSVEPTKEIESMDLDLEVNGKRFAVRVLDPPTVANSGSNARAREGRVARTRVGITDSIMSPMHGTVIAVKKAVEESIVAGETVFVIEAMKMENEVVAPRDGVVAEIVANVGDTVDSGQLLAKLTPDV